MTTRRNKRRRRANTRNTAQVPAASGIHFFALFSSGASLRRDALPIYFHFISILGAVACVGTGSNVLKLVQKDFRPFRARQRCKGTCYYHIERRRKREMKFKIKGTRHTKCLPLNAVAESRNTWRNERAQRNETNWSPGHCTILHFQLKCFSVVPEDVMYHLNQFP